MIIRDDFEPTVENSGHDRKWNTHSRDESIVVSFRHDLIVDGHFGSLALPGIGMSENLIVGAVYLIARRAYAPDYHFVELLVMRSILKEEVRAQL